MNNIVKTIPIDGHTQWYALLGHPVAHSLSPAMHNAAFAQLKINGCYGAYDVPPSSLKQAVEGLAALGFKGGNVTVPHKQAIFPLLKEIDQAAAAIGAVNTLVYLQELEGYKGYNTDCLGYVQGLKEQGFSCSQKNTVLLGAGGAARAVAFGLAQEGCQSIIIVNRSLEKAQELAQDLMALYKVKAQACSWVETKILDTALAEAQLLVNTTSVGMDTKSSPSQYPVSLQWLIRPHLFVSDIVYKPPLTPLLVEGKRQGCSVQNGLPMLLYQGVEAFRLWTGLEPQVQVMAEAMGLIDINVK